MAGVMFKVSLLQQILVSWLVLSTVIAAREIQETTKTRAGAGAGAGASGSWVSLQEEGGMMECWNALLEMKSCTNEIVMFFFNGDSYLGMDCCRAIRVITVHCWPSMLTSLGYTSEEGDILRDYCGTSSSSSSPSSPQPSTTHA